LLPERGNKCMASLHGPQAVACAMGKLAEGARTKVAQLMVLQMSPDILRRVELGSIGGEILQLDRSFEAIDVVAHELAAMSGQTVPDHQHFLPDLPPQGVEKLNQLRTFDRPWKESEVEALKSDPGDCRELVPVEVVLQDRGLPARSPTANLSGSFAQSRLVDEDNDSALFSGVFLTRASERASSGGSPPRRARAHERWVAGC
jgi:hypothetical protein